MSVISPEATPDKALRIFATLVRDQEVEGSNPFAPTNFFNNLHVTSGFSATALQSILSPKNPQDSTSSPPIVEASLIETFAILLNDSE